MPAQFDQARVDGILGGDPLLTRDEAADRLRIDVSQMDDLAAAGTIPWISPGGAGGRSRRFRTSAIDAYAEQHPV